jgi:hypothetical protein
MRFDPFADLQNITQKRPADWAQSGKTAGQRLDLGQIEA